MGYLIDKIFQGVVWLMLSAIQLFFGYIDICDAILTTFVIWCIMHLDYGWGNWWAVGLGLAISLVAYIIFKHPVGFWIATTLYSIAWGIFLTTITSIIFFPNIEEKLYWIWVAVIGVISFVNHYGAYWRPPMTDTENPSFEETTSK